MLDRNLPLAAAIGGGTYCICLFYDDEDDGVDFAIWPDLKKKKMFPPFFPLWSHDL